MTGSPIKYSTVIALAVASVFLACAPAKNVPDGEYLLDRVKIKADHRHIDTDELYTLVKQKPNKRILWYFRFHLWVYNRYKKDNQNKLKNTVGEPPVIYDTTLTQSTMNQLSLSLKNKGYYDNQVDLKVKLKRKRAKITYLINTGEPYYIRKLHYKIKDNFLDNYLASDSSHSLLKPGSRFDISLMEKERSRILTLLKNYGYYYITKDHIYFEADTTQGNKKVDLFLKINNAMQPVPGMSDSLREEEHGKYKIHNIYVRIDNELNGTPTDTINQNGINFIYSGKLLFKPKALERAIFINKGGYYQIKDQEQTYRRLSSLRNFKYINISFEQSGDPEDNLLDCFIRLSPVTSMSFSAEANYTNSGGNYGVEGTLGFQHLNTFKGAEVLNVRLNGGLEVQQLSLKDENRQVIGQFPFNTFEFGPEVNVHIPTFLLPFGYKKYSKNNNPKTSFLAAYNFQQRPDYTRTLTNFSLSYSWYETATKQHIIQPVDLSFIRLNKSQSFEQRLQETNNSLLINSYTDHFISAAKYSFILNTQSLKKKTFVFFRGNLEIAGNMLHLYNNAANRPKNESNSYDAFNVRYAQYVRTDLELKYYITRTHTSLVFRTITGLGKPYGNLDVLPFEKSFFAGGSNGIRAWRARDLGPGSLPKTLTDADNIDQIGDFKWEGNIEYRFDLSKLFEAAIFTDFGNIWLLGKDDKRPDAEIDPSRLWRDLAIGTGIGLRLDFSFFLIRFDLAVRAKDPGEDKPEKLSFKQFDSPILNFGIGYPF